MQQEIDRYVKYLVAERNASPHTVSNYRREIMQFAAFAQAHGVNSWSEVTPSFLRQWLAELHRAGYVKASVVRRLSEMRAFYAYLRRNGQVEINPMQAILSPKLPQRLPRPLTREEVDLLIDAPDLSTPQGLRDRAMLELLYSGGLRISEVLALDVTDVSLAEGQLHVAGKGAKERVALVGHKAIEALAGYLDRGRPKLAEASLRYGGKTRADGKWLTKRPVALFLNRFGQRLSVSMFTRLLSAYAEAAGITHAVTPHMLRHSFATHMLDGGADLRSVQELMGHESVSTTQIYTQVSQKQLRETILKAHPRARKNS